MKFDKDWPKIVMHPDVTIEEVARVREVFDLPDAPIVWDSDVSPQMAYKIQAPLVADWTPGFYGR